MRRAMIRSIPTYAWVWACALLLVSTTTTLEAQTFSLTDATGQPGDQVLSIVSITNDEEASGWQFGVCHDGAELAVIDAVLGATAETVNGGGNPGFFGIVTDPAGGDGVTMGAIVDLMGVNNLPVGTDQEVLDITYELIGDPVLEDPDLMDDVVPPIEADIEFCDNLGEPAVVTAIIISGTDVTPIADNGIITIVPPPTCDFELTCEGGLTDVIVSWEVLGDDALCFDYFLIHRDGELLELLDNDVTMYEDLGLDPGTYSYVLIGVTFLDDPLGLPEVVTKQCTGDVIPLVFDDFTPLVGPYAGGTEVTITGQGFTLGTGFTVEFGGVTADNIMVIDDMTATCDTPPSATIGTVPVFISTSLGDATAVESFTYGFIRGDFNGDGSVSIADPLPLLEYLFTGGAAPECFDAADANDDLIVDVADPVYVLQYLFDPMGNPAPPLPFPEAGLDPVGGDPFDCLGVM